MVHACADGSWRITASNAGLMGSASSLPGPGTHAHRWPLRSRVPAWPPALPVEGLSTQQPCLEDSTTPPPLD